MNALRNMSQTTKRLLLLTLFTLGPAIPAIASGCQSMSTTCPDGSSTGAVVCCRTGGGYVDCECTSWSSSTGYSGCFLVAGCS